MTTKVGAESEYCIISLNENDEASDTKNENMEEETETNSLPPKRYKLVVSDYFEAPVHTFRDGSDPCWNPLHNSDYTTYTQHLYCCDNVYINNDGKLAILAEAANNDIIGFDKVTKKRS